MSQERIETIVTELATPAAAELGYELVDVEYGKEGSNWVLRCLIDCETGIGVDECQRFSEVLGKLLDEADPIPGSYLLEVSSPGIERPLKKDSDFVKFAGNQVEIILAQAIDGKKIYRGKLAGILAEQDLKSIRVVSGDGRTIEIPRQIIKKARLIAEVLSPKKGGYQKK